MIAVTAESLLVMLFKLVTDSSLVCGKSDVSEDSTGEVIFLLGGLSWNNFGFLVDTGT